MSGAPSLSLPIYASAMPGIRWPALPGPRGVMRLALLHQLSESQWWSEERLRAQQLSQLNALIAHARAQSPYHREKLAGLPPVLTEAEWADLPLLTRETVQSDKDQIRCAAFPAEHGRRQPVFSSGSTGKPVATEQTDLSQLFWEAFTLRDHAWHRRDLSGKLGSLRHYPAHLIHAKKGALGPNWGSATADLYQTGPVAMLNVTATLADQLDWLKREDPDVLLTHPTVLDALIRSMETQEGHARASRLREVRTLSESLPDGLRERCQAVLGVPLTDIYSARETGYLALQCPDHPHYHIQSEGARVEVLDDQGRACQAGDIGRVVVTPLHNFAFPLLRYELGDYAQVGTPCPCGRGLPVIARVMGRQRNMLTYPDGRQTWPILNFRALHEIVPMRQMRMTQRTLTHIDVELVTTIRPDASQQDRLCEAIRHHLGHPFQVTLNHVPHIERSPGGKFEDFVSLVRPSSPT